MSGEEGFEWEVRLPDRVSAPLGARKPLAVISFGDPNGRESLYVPIAVAKKLQHLKGSGEINPQSRAELLFELKKCEETCVSNRVVDLISRRDYSKHELSEKLRMDGYPTNCFEQAVSRACEGGLVDDCRFAEAYVRSKLSCGWGLRKIERSLKEKGIEPDDVEGWPDAFLDGETELDRARALVSTRRVPAKNAFEKTARFLASRGYSSSVAYKVARMVADENVSD